MSLDERAIKIYRQFFTKGSNKNKSIKNFIYSVTLFFAKRFGSILFFFTEKEKNFEKLKNDKQYEIFLSNSYDRLQSFEKNKTILKIDIVLNYNQKTR